MLAFDCFLFLVYSVVIFLLNKLAVAIWCGE